jgi:pectate lyase-like protein
MRYLTEIKWLTTTRLKMQLAVSTWDKWRLTGPYGSFPIQFVTLVTSNFLHAARKAYGFGATASAKNLPPKSETLILPIMRSIGGPPWLLSKRLYISLLVSFGLVVSSTFLKAQLIPADRLTDWTPGVRVGVPGGIPTNRTRLIDVTIPPYNADRTGSTDASQAIQAAINAAAPNDVVYLPGGTYRLHSGITPKSNVTLRGAGSDSTTLKFYGSLSAGISSRASSAGFWDPTTFPVITGGATKGSTVLTIADTSAFTVGRMLQVARFNSTNQFDNPLITNVQGNSAGHGYGYKQKTNLVSKTATTLTVFPPIFGDMSGATVRACPGAYSLGGVGIEDLVLDLSNSTTMFGIFLEEHVGSWIKGVKVKGASNYSVHLMDCLLCELRDSYLDELNHSGTNGAGLLFNATSATLVENNIIRNSFPSIEVNSGSSGNVFGYNFCLNDNGLFSIDTNHGPHNAYNLYEGNIANNLIADGYFGSVARDTVFRNWFHGLGAGWGISLKRFTREYSIIGNVLGAPSLAMTFDGAAFGQPNIGNAISSGMAPPWAHWGTSAGPGGFQELDLGVQATLVRKGNYNYFDKAIPAGESLGSDPLPNSLYLTAKPGWFGNLAWPPINPLSPGSPDATTIYQKIPAGYRFVNGTNPSGATAGGGGISTPTSTPAPTPTQSSTPAPTPAPTATPSLSFNQTKIQDLRITAASGPSVDLAWSPLSGAIGYIVYYGISAQYPERSKAVGTSTSASITGLTSGVTTYFHVQAFDRTGVLNQPSNQFSYSPGAAPSSTPAPPVGLKVLPL